MTVKRFYVAESNLIDGYCVFDREKKYAFHPRPRKADCLNDAHTLNELHEKNNELRLQLNLCSDQRNEFHRGARENANRVGKLEKENEQLKQRNDRQAKRLAELYELMAKKDWESLTEIINDFCSCEEQLQREWRTY